jgi:hypothetical protein
MTTVSTADVSVIQVDGGFALSLAGSPLRSRAGNILMHRSEELMQYALETLHATKEVAIDNGVLTMPISTGPISMLTVMLDVVAQGKDRLSADFGNVLMADPMLFTIAGPEQISREGAYQPVYMWLQDEISVLRSRAAELESYAFDRELVGPVPDDVQSVIEHVQWLYTVLSDEQRTVVNVLTALHDRCLLLAMSLILNPECDSNDYAEGVIAALMLDANVFTDVQEGESATILEQLKRDAEQAMQFLALADDDLDQEVE